MALRKAFAAFLLLAVAAALTSAGPEGPVSLGQLLKETGGKLYWDPVAGFGVIAAGSCRISFKEGGTFILFDRAEAASCEPVERREGSIWFGESAMRAIRSYLARAAEAERAAAKFKVAAIVIDPGHGGKDPGAVGERTVKGKKEAIREKDVVLDAGKRLRDRLVAAYPDKKVVMTRGDDTYIELDERSEIANRIELGAHEAVIYVSLHVNSSLRPGGRGYEVWYLKPEYRRDIVDAEGRKELGVIAPIIDSMLEEEFTTESIIIARSVLSGLDAAVGDLSPSRGIKEGEWAVVRNSKMPAVLVEVGFLSNPDEAVLLSDPAYLKRITDGIYNGLASFIGDFESTRGFTK